MSKRLSIAVLVILFVIFGTLIFIQFRCGELCSTTFFRHFVFTKRAALCGDSICQYWEDRKGTCPADCVPIEPPKITPPIMEPASPTEPSEEPTEPSTFAIKSMKVIKNYAKSVDWHHEKNLILTARIGLDGYYDIMALTPDGNTQTCLTCNQTKIPQKHIGGASWHPSGNWIVFTAEKDEVPDDEELDFQAIPGRGLNNDLFVMNSSATGFWKIHELPLTVDVDIPAVIHPQFSHDGTKLLWAERLGQSRRPLLGWGEWALKLADFSVTNSEPKISNIQTLQLGEQVEFYESHAFSADDTKIMFSGNLQKDQYASGLDIYEHTLGTNTLTRLTDTMEDWDEHSHWSPDGDRIAWMSSEGLGIEFPDQKDWHLYLKSELWMMNADGTNRTQLTHFNTEGYPEFKDVDQVIIGDSSWGPNGELVMALAYTGAGGQLGGRELIIVEFE